MFLNTTQEDFIIFALAIGDGVDLSELKAMVINESYIYEVNSFDTLQDFLPTLQNNLCSELPLPQDVEDGVTAPPFHLRGPSLEIFNSTSRV
ncbi:deleted in malignant brain tumors 1 protein, partial [Elysia marginata]